VATAAQEFVVWIPLRLTGLLILAGLTLGLVPWCAPHACFS